MKKGKKKAKRQEGGREEVRKKEIKKLFEGDVECKCP